MTAELRQGNLSRAKITPDVLRQWRADLTRWASPEDYLATLRQIRTHDDLHDAFFTQAGLAFLRDAWVASRVAMRLSASQVRLCQCETPDFEIMVDEELRRYEVTEADLPGRRRGDEKPKALDEDPVEAWRKRFEAIGPSVSSVVAKKIAKQYEPGTRLVIYVNLGCYGAYLDEGVPVMMAATEAAKDKFAEVLAYWEGNLYRLWDDGRSDLRIWTSGELDEDV